MHRGIVDGGRGRGWQTEERHREDRVDVADVVAEKDATEAGEGAHQVGLEGDRRLDAAGVGGRGETRHDGGVFACYEKVTEWSGWGGVCAGRG